MKIKSNSSKSEVDSPYFVRNKKFCKEFESFILEKNGNVKGNFNAWSFSIIGKITKPNTWILRYKKATFTSGNLFLSSKYQNLLTMAEWKTTNRFGSNFKIRKKSFIDFFNLQLDESLSILDFSDKYLIINGEQNNKFIKQMLKILKPLFLSGEIYKIENSNDNLKIELRTEKLHFDIFEKLKELKA
ncbi:hypothetical protein [Psychroflexus aestuariivivens]|uniref:hypothetical protein n=1 Tax=Psychroflexus aestuariivivens TaxID=1795040 RepID=UPI000FDC0067|nr:hypothetical protein [Psychroflexus aestuariivivens]